MCALVKLSIAKLMIACTRTHLTTPARHKIAARGPLNGIAALRAVLETKKAMCAFYMYIYISAAKSIPLLK